MTPHYAIHQVYSDYAFNAKRRGLAFELTFEQFKQIISENCYLCGCEPEHRTRTRNKKTIELYFNGIDRKSNKEGYVLSNVAACCTTCNRIKSNFDLEFLRQHIAKIMQKVTHD